MYFLVYVIMTLIQSVLPYIFLRDAMRDTTRSSVVIAKVIVTAMGCYMLGLIIYAFAIDGFPFYVELLTPCMITSLIDVSIHIVVFSVWIAYKESSWTSAVFWIILLVCFSGDTRSSDPLLMVHSVV
ncbi:hypothetical protein Hanom_Chr11g00968041 [Helianthus anomalus]